MIELTDPDDGVTTYYDEDIDSGAPAADFAPYNESLLALIQEGSNWGSGRSTQDSTAAAGLIAGSGRVEAQVNLGFAVPPSFANSGSLSIDKLRFGVSEPRLTQICASISADSPSAGAGTYAVARVRVRRVIDGGLAPYFGYSNDDVGPGPYYFSLRLDPGEYEIEFMAQASASTSSGNPGQANAMYEAFIESLGVPCSIADVAVPTGVLDLRDISGWIRGYIGAYDIDNPTYDLATPFGVLDLQDITAFIGAFQSGCD